MTIETAVVTLQWECSVYLTQSSSSSLQALGLLCHNATHSVVNYNDVDLRVQNFQDLSSLS